MSIILTGDTANVTTPLTRTVTGAANNGTGEIRITTSAPHLFGDGDTVLISGVTGVTVANGYWTIEVIDATHFDLVGSTLSGVYGGGGSALDISITPQIQFPTDGDQATINSGLLSGLQALCDRTQYLNRRLYPLTGAQYSLIAVNSYGATGGSFSTNFFNAGTWESVATFTAGHEQALGGGFPVLVGDVVDLAFSSTSYLENTLAGTFQAALALEASENGGGIGSISNAFQEWQSKLGASEDEQRPISLVGLRSVGASGTFQPYINGCLPGGATGGGFLRCVLAWSLVAKVWRPRPI